MGPFLAAFLPALMTGVGGLLRNRNQQQESRLPAPAPAGAPITQQLQTFSQQQPGGLDQLLMGMRKQRGYKDGGLVQRPGDKPDRFMNQTQFDKRFAATEAGPMGYPVTDEEYWQMLMRRQQMMNSGRPPLQGEMVGGPWPQLPGGPTPYAQGGLVQGPAQPPQAPQGLGSLPQAQPQKRGDPKQDQHLVQMAIAAVQGKVPNPQQILQIFVARFGQKALMDLINRVQGGAQGQAGNGPDDVPAIVDGQEPAALASGEFVVPRDVVNKLGQGEPEAGGQVLEGMMNQVRGQSPYQ